MSVLLRHVHIFTSPRLRQGNRIWNFRVFSAAWTLADLLLEPRSEESDREQNGIEVGTSPLSRGKAPGTTSDCIQQGFHMRLPCRTRGEVSIVPAACPVSFSARRVDFSTSR